MADARTAVLVRVTGRVQGVNFRAWTRQTARKLGLTGWVRNEADGSVRALLVGPEAGVAEMIAALREGPRAAAVDEVAAETVDVVEPPEAFAITG